MNRRKKSHRERSLLWKPISPRRQSYQDLSTVDESLNNTDYLVNSGGHNKEVYSSQRSVAHILVDSRRNQVLREYEMDIKSRFDNIEATLKDILHQRGQNGFVGWANQQLYAKLGVKLTDEEWLSGLNMQAQKGFQHLYAKTLFAQFLRMSDEFFTRDPLFGQKTQEAELLFNELGFHAVGIAPCADGRLAHFISYVLRLPYGVVRRKAHAGALFDISESVRNWVFIEHTRFRDGKPNSADDPTCYLKIAVYHYSKVDPTHQGCAAHASDDHKAAESALKRLKDFRQAIENRFGCGSTVQILLLGLNTDDDSLKVHVPDANGDIELQRYVETDTLYNGSLGLSEQQANELIDTALISSCQLVSKQAPKPQILKLLHWFIRNNFSQIAYVNKYEGGLYEDLGHAERFIGIGSGFEEIQLRNLTYYSFLDTIEEGVNDVDVGIKIFKGLNVKKLLPIPVIIRCDFDGRVPGSKDRAEQKALRLERAVKSRYQELQASGLLQVLVTLRDYTNSRPAEVVIKNRTSTTNGRSA